MDELLKQRDGIHASFTISKSANHIGASAMSNGSSSKSTGDDTKVENLGEDGTSDEKDKSFKRDGSIFPEDLTKSSVERITR